MWSLGNHMAAEEVSTLVDRHFAKNYGPEVERQFSRDQALGIVHAAIWGVAVRAGSTAGAYAFSALAETLGLKGWTFDQEEADALRRFRTQKAEADWALRAQSAIPTPDLSGRSALAEAEKADRP